MMWCMIDGDVGFGDDLVFGLVEVEVEVVDFFDVWFGRDYDLVVVGLLLLLV